MAQELRTVEMSEAQSIVDTLCGSPHRDEGASDYGVEITGFEHNPSWIGDSIVMIRVEDRDPMEIASKRSLGMHGVDEALEFFHLTAYDDAYEVYLVATFNDGRKLGILIDCPL